jgi:hypothetical protein
MEALIIGAPAAQSTGPVTLFGADNKPLALSDENQAIILSELAAAVAQLEALKKPAKNKVAGIPKQVTYILLSKTLASWGKVPQQQQDIAEILARHLEVGVPRTEAEVFDIVTRESVNYTSLAKSVQHPTYLFKYYRGLKHDHKHAGFVARGFLKAA